MAKDNDLLEEGREAFRLADDAERDNRTTYLEDIKFARANEQWDTKWQQQRVNDGRPCLTIPKLDAFIRQVVNDARQNKPAIQIHPADSGADPATAKLVAGLIRNIETTSNADVAYDTATECAVSGGFGYLRVGLDYADEDAFDMDLSIQRVSNPLAIYGDPDSSAADSSDWDSAFVTDRLTKGQWKRQYGDKAKVDWHDDTAWKGENSELWRDEDTVLVAEWWRREQYEKKVYQLSNGMVMSKEDMEDQELQVLMQNGMIQVKQERMAKCHRVKQIIMSGAEILEENDWLGRYIPIIPVYGLEFNIAGKRYWRSLINGAKDAQRMYNIWRSTSTELVALAPRVPFIGPKGAFDSDQARWNTANTQSHAYLEYDPIQAAGGAPPMRQPLDSGPAAGALQEALNANDDIKSVIGMYDASLGQKSNETSGKAIMARQREGDVSTFHFMDNMARAIRHTGRILIDLIPKVYTGERMIRILGEDGKAEIKQLGQGNQQAQGPDGQPAMDERGNAIMAVHDLTVGKYDLTVKTGPSFTTMREEATQHMTEIIQAYPQSAPIIAPELFKQMDWPGAEELGEKMEQQAQGQVPPELQKQMQDGMQQIQQLTQENQQLKMDNSAAMQKAQSDAQIAEFKAQKDTEVAQFKANAEIQLKRELASAEMDLKRAETAAKVMVTREQGDAQVQIAREKGHNDMQVKREQIASSEKVGMSKVESGAKVAEQANKLKAKQAPKK